MSSSPTTTTASKDLPPLPTNFFPQFIRNQFLTTIPLPTPTRFPHAQGQTCIITGCNTGIGYEAAKQFLSLGIGRLIMGVRSVTKGQEAAERLRKDTGSKAKIDVWELEMESYASIRAFVDKCREDQGGRIEIVILNAGMAALTFEKVAGTGHERTMQVNHLSTALLAMWMVDVLKGKAGKGGEPPRLAVVNSVTGHLAKFPNKGARPLLASFDDVEVTPWDGNERYGISKLMSQMFVVRLSEHVDRNEVVISLAEPGLIKGTSLFREASGLMRVAVRAFTGIAGRPVAVGAATYVDAVLGHGKEVHGCFIMNCEVAGLAKYYHSNPEVVDLVWKETLQDLRDAGLDVGLVAK